MSTRLLLALAVLVMATTARAQDQLPEGHAPVSDEALRRALGEGPPIAESAPSTSVPAGVIDALILDGDNEPVVGTSVRLGTMVAGASRQRFAVTDATGHARFTGLEPGGRDAHRVTLSYQGARYLTAPFTMGPTSGQAVVIRRLDTTSDLRLLLQRVGQLVVEFQKPGRLHITQSVELMNLGDRTLVLPSGGLAVPLPRGFLAFQSERSMNDQRISPTPTGFKISGSLPPGRLAVNWSYDLPFSGEDASFSQRIPFRQTASYQVVVDAADGMHLDVARFPDAQFTNYQGRRLLYTEMELTPDDEPLSELRVEIRGIPGPGPYRWVAIAGAIVLLGYGLRLAFTRGGADRIGREERLRHGEALLDELQSLAKEHAAGDVGDVFFARERERIVDELALLEKRELDAGSAMN